MKKNKTFLMVIIALMLASLACGSVQVGIVSPTLEERVLPIVDTQEIPPSPYTPITATLTEEIPPVSTPTPTQETIPSLTPTRYKVIFPSPTAEIPATPTDEVLGGFVQGDVARTGLDEVDQIIHIVLTGNIIEIRQRIKFTTTGCTHEMALGGPPKCREGELEGALVDVLPFMGPEGHFLRRDEINEWQGIDADGLYAVYRVSSEAYSNENYPVGEYGIVFRTNSPNIIVTLQVKNSSILRIDSLFGTPPKINFERDAQEIILPPGKYIFEGCSGAPLQRVTIGDKASVCTKTDDLMVREVPGIDGEELARIKPGTSFMIVDGPSCADNWSWWKVELDSGLEGWVAEGGDTIDPYFLCPVE